MAEENQEHECDIDDLMCQMRVMSHLEGMDSALGHEAFRAKFPDFASMQEVVRERIKEQETNLRQAFENCGLPVPEGLESRVHIETVMETSEVPREE